MELLISSLLVLTISVILVLYAAITLYRISILFSLSFLKTHAKSSLTFSAKWGMFTIQVSNKFENWVIEGKIRNFGIFIKPMNQDRVSNIITDEQSSASDIRDMLPFIPAIKFLIVELLRHITLDKIHGQITFGAGDPVTTGYIYGLYHAVNPLFLVQNIHFDLIPDFNHLKFEGEIQMNVRFITPLEYCIRGSRHIIPLIIKRKGIN
jgi:hypothetical protein